MACTFSTSQLPKVVRPWCVLYILTSKCASRHNGVQFFISHLASWLRTRRFSEPTFRPSGVPNHWKNTVFRDFPTFSRICIFFLLRLSLIWFSFFFPSLLWLFPSLLFICPYCRKFDFKLPSILIFILFHFMFDFISPSPEASARKWVSRVTLSCRRRSLAESQSWTLTSKCQTCWARCTRHICDDMITELVEAWYKNTAEGLDEASQSISFYFVISKIHGRPIVRPASIPPTHS